MNASSRFSAVSAVDASWMAIFFPFKSSGLFTGLSFSTAYTWMLSMYGLVNASFFCRSGVMVKPFQMQSMRPEFSSVSLEAQSIGLNSMGTPISLETALAISISKPTILPLSSRNPIGANVSSIPATIFAGLPPAALDAASFLSPPPQPASIPAAPSAKAPAIIIFFQFIFMVKSPLFPVSSFLYLSKGFLMSLSYKMQILLSSKELNR